MLVSRIVSLCSATALSLLLLASPIASGQTVGADLSVTDTGPAAPVQADSNLIYTLTVSNAGLDPTLDADLTDSLPTDAIFVSASDAGTYDASTQTVTWQLGAIAAGDSRSVNIEYQPVEPGMPMNSAQVASSIPDPDLSNNVASASTEVDPQPNTFYVSVTDGGFNPAIVRTPPPPVSVQWNFFGPSSNGVHESYGLGLYDSGPIAPVSSCVGPSISCGYYRFDFPFTAEITSKDVFGHVFKLAIPVDVEPSSGTINDTFTVTYASGAFPSGYVDDIQIRAPGTTKFVRWRYGLHGTSVRFKSSDPFWQGPGIYAFRDRLRNTLKKAPAHSKQGPKVSITVTGS